MLALSLGVCFNLNPFKVQLLTEEEHLRAK